MVAGQMASADNLRASLTRQPYRRPPTFAVARRQTGAVFAGETLLSHPKTGNVGRDVS
jgi:hypothetical protein